MRMLVTGAAGFIGTHLARSLAQDGHHVVAVDVSEFHTDLTKSANVTCFTADIRDITAIAKAMENVDVVFHQAAMASVPESFADVSKCMDVNVVGSSIIFEQARLAGVKRIVMASTSAIYGDDPTPVKHEGLVPAPRSPYAVSKLAMEDLADVYSRQYAIEMVALRYFNVYGPGQPAEGGYAAVIPAFIAALRAGKAAQIYGDGSQTRAFVHVDDVVRANIAAATVPLQDAGALVVNIASSEVTTIADLLEEIATSLNGIAAVKHLEWRDGDILHSRADVSRAKEIMEFESAIPIRQGLAELVRLEKV